MPVFEYTATDTEGKPVRGTLMSSTLASAAEDLARQGLQVQHLGTPAALHDPIPSGFQSSAGVDRSGYPERSGEEDITAQRSYVMTDIVGPLVNKVPLSQLLFFFRQLGTMLSAGVGMVQTLDTLAGQTKDPRLRSVVNELREHALAGRPMSVGMQRYPEMFNPLMLSLTRVGEQSGMMDKVATQIAEYLEREIELRNLLRRVTIYPKLVLAASIIIVLGTNAIIASLGKKGGLDSILTRPETWVVLAPLIIFLFLFTRVGLHNPRAKYTWDNLILMLPGFGTVVRQLSMAKFGRAFGVLYSGGVPVPRSVELAADACGNEFIRARVYPAGRALEEGVGITYAFERTGVFTPIVLDMTRTGETTGNLDFMLDKVSEFYEGEAQTRAVQFGHAFGVLVLLVVAIYVGYTVITFYSGYFGGIQSAANG